MDRTEFLSAVVSVIRYNEGPDSGINAANLGALLRRKAGLNWAEHGFGKLSDVLLELEAQRRIKVERGTGVGIVLRTLSEAVVAGGEPSKDSCEKTLPAPAQHPRKPTQYLKSVVWNAFIAATPKNRRLFNPQSCQVWLTPDSPPGSADSWRIVEPITDEEQRAWARDFLLGTPLESEPEVLGSLTRDDWYLRFPQLLRAKMSPNAAAAWNRVRSERTIRHVGSWASRNAVPPEAVFESVPPLAEKPPNRAAPSAPSALRPALLDAISHMSLDELLAIPIPARHLVAALRPELLGS
jgi:hypothetical protein